MVRTRLSNRRVQPQSGEPMKYNKSLIGAAPIACGGFGFGAQPFPGMRLCNKSARDCRTCLCWTEVAHGVARGFRINCIPTMFRARRSLCIAPNWTKSLQTHPAARHNVSTYSHLSRQKKAQPVVGCAKVPPKEEVLEECADTRTSVQHKRIMPDEPIAGKIFLLLCNKIFSCDELEILNRSCQFTATLQAAAAPG